MGQWLKRVAVAGTGAIILAGATLGAQEALRSVSSGVYSDAQAERGSVAYGSNCRACHGDTLAGIDVAPALAGGSFVGNWSGQTVADLVTRIRTTMPLDRPGTLATGTVTDIVAHILKSNGFPAGSVDLPRDAQLQAQIRIDAPGAVAP